MKRPLTWKTIFLSIVGATLLVVVAGLAVTLGVGQAKTSTGTATLKTRVQAVPRLALCMVRKEVTTLTVHRGTFMNPTTFSFPSVVFIGNAASARSVAKAICAIPPDMRTGTMGCPFDQGLTYKLVFTLPKYVIAPIILRGSGFCSAADGTGKQGWIRPTQNFFRVLGNAMQLHLATMQTFAGKMT